MNKLYEKLEFNLVLAKISTYAHLQLSKDKIKRLRFNVSYDKVNKALNKTNELMKIFKSENPYDLNRLYELNEILEKKYLNGLELRYVSNQYEVITNIIRYANKLDGSDYPLFKDTTSKLIKHQELSEMIRSKFNQEGLIYEDASPTLIRISKELKETERIINDTLKNYINNNTSHLMEPIITYRNNRAVIPVKVDSKNIIKGIIHDESSSKQTLFIEPNQIIDLNNKLQSLENAKSSEVKKILEELSNLVLVNKEELLSNEDILVDLDILKAKALYSIDINGVIPIINKDSAKLEIFQGRHPLIDDDKVVANDFYIANDESGYRIVLISGSNTGGKTVALKMLGIFALMSQCGLAIPANEGSNLPVYTQIFVDIGDEQSIVNSLSTFSAHITNVAKIIDNVSQYSLILLDEIGSGTDPKEGENLALAIIEYLYNNNASVVLTTHYSKLKDYALTRDYVRLASVVFDEDYSRPTYKIIFDSMAASNAFDIARYLGLNDEIVNEAKKLYESDLSNPDKLMIRLAEKEMKLKQQEILLREQKVQLKQLNATVLKKEKDLNEKSDNIIQKAQEQANEIIKKTQQESKRIIKELKKQNKFVNHEVNKIRQDLDSLYIEDNQASISYDFKVNDQVELIKLKRRGIIKKVLNNGFYEVQIGNLSSKVKADELIFVSKAPQENKKVIKSRNQVNKSVPFELNLIGLRVEDALIELKRYLDSAIVANKNKVRVIHGFGTGALRKAVHETLKKNKHVSKYYFADYNEGGQGATIVELK